MLSKIIIAFAILGCLIAPAHADAREDATVIVELTVTKDVFDSAMGAIAELMAGNIQNEVAKSGASMSDGAAKVVTEMMSEGMTSEMVDRMTGPMVQAYIDNHSPEALAAYRAFLETPEGQEIAANIPAMTNEGSIIGENIGEEVAQIAVGQVISDVADDNWPEGTPKTVQRELRELFNE